MAITLETPGVYINEVNAFPNSVVSVATAVPAFIGYTQRASYKGRSVLMKAVRINSFNEFMVFFGALTSPTDGSEPQPADEAAQYAPIYYPTLAAGQGEIEVGGQKFDLLPDASSIYYLFNAIRLFYENGGGSCYVVSVGAIGKPSGKPLAAGAPLVNPNIQYKDLKAGLDIVGKETGPTMLVVPDAVLLDAGNYGTLMQNMLEQCNDLQDRVALFDVLGGETPDPLQFMDDVKKFRTDIGVNYLKYGIAYYPYVKTTITQPKAMSYETLGGAKSLATLFPQPTPDVKELLAYVAAPAGLTVEQIDSSLRLASKDYSRLQEHLLEKVNTLPPASAMAGVYTAVDNDKGVWQAPAGVSLVAVTDTTLNITDSLQRPLNVDGVTGKSINVIRMFPGFGSLVWGGRTLDGNSNDWRYVNVRRTIIMLEQSLKNACRSYVWQPNTNATWSLVQTMITAYLTQQWQQGAIVGATPEAAFDVAVGLGTTMTPQDILEGVMRVTVRVAPSRPAEFIVLTFQQKLQTS